MLGTTQPKTYTFLTLQSLKLLINFKYLHQGKNCERTWQCLLFSTQIIYEQKYKLVAGNINTVFKMSIVLSICYVQIHLRFRKLQVLVSYKNLSAFLFPRTQL